MEPFYAWILSFIVAHSPPGHPQQFPDAREDEVSALERYQSIARDLVEVVYDPAEPPLLAGPLGRAKTVTILLGVIFKESAFRRDVDMGIGPYSKGDGGRSVCMLQIQTPFGRSADWNARKQRFAWTSDSPSDIQPGFTTAQLLADRKACFRAGLRIVRVSWQSCPGVPEEERLRVYASGSCRYGRAASLERMGLARNWYRVHPPPLSDEQVAQLRAPAAANVVALEGDSEAAARPTRSLADWMTRTLGWLRIGDH